MTDNDYLWDRSGPPDDDVLALERALAPLAHRAGTVPFDLSRAGVRPGSDRGQTLLPPYAAATAGDRDRALVNPRWSMRGRVLVGLSMAATVALVTLSALVGTRSLSPDWRVSTIDGTPRVNQRDVVDAVTWHAGDRLETGFDGHAEIKVGSIGTVEVRPNSVVLLSKPHQSEHRLALERGSIRALIWAPPGQFVVDTPSAAAVDLGCAYTLDVDPDGSGLLRVELGWVGFRHDGRDSFIPQGAVCATRAGRGPGTPHYADAPGDFVNALSVFDFGDSSARATALASALSHARARDALSLWHLLSRTRGEERALVYDRFAALSPPPDGVTRGGVIAGNRAMLDAWWDSLGMESVSWWRMWETPWPR